jgi:hypothetical protein
MYGRGPVAAARAVMTPRRHWRSYGNEPLPAPQEALGQPFAAFPFWFLRIECDRCHKVQMVNESHVPWRNRTLRDVLKRMRSPCRRHDLRCQR